MTAATATSPEVAEYLAAVRKALRDLPDAERDDLVTEVEPSLVEAAAEGGAISARLGPPEEFAAELRSAAGLHDTVPAREREPRIVLRTRELLERLKDDPSVAALRRLGHELAPIGWVARGYIAVGFVAYALDVQWSTTNPAIPRLGSGEAGLLAILLSVVVSVWLGLQGRRRGWRDSRVARVANIAVVLAALPVAFQLADTSDRDLLVTMAYAPAPVPDQAPRTLLYGGASVENIYPYTRDGRLLHDVLLYDSAGRPLEIGGLGDPQRRLLETDAGFPLFNSFPIRYFEPGTGIVANPDAGPPVEVPKIATPALGRRKR